LINNKIKEINNNSILHKQLLKIYKQKNYNKNKLDQKFNNSIKIQ